MNVLLLASHAVAEYDDVRMFSDMGVDVFAPGGYSEPAKPAVDLRPPLPGAPDHPELRRLCDIQRQVHSNDADGWAIDWAKADLHPDLIEWADAIIVHHFPDRWIAGQWEDIKHKRVIWRTCGQSNPEIEIRMRHLRSRGLEIVRYSPAEQRHFEPRGTWAGQDAMIRFGKYPDDYGPWHTDDPHHHERYVANVSQWRSGESATGRGGALNLNWYLGATEGLPARPAGPGSEVLPGGLGPMSWHRIIDYLSHAAVYVYTGTTPASYTLGLMEAMLSGVPVLSIGPKAWGIPDLFEGHEMASAGFHESAQAARRDLTRLVADEPDSRLMRAALSEASRSIGVELFGIETIMGEWAAFLDAAPVRLPTYATVTPIR